MQGTKGCNLSFWYLYFCPNLNGVAVHEFIELPLIEAYIALCLKLFFVNGSSSCIDLIFTSNATLVTDLELTQHFTKLVIRISFLENSISIFLYPSHFIETSRTIKMLI